MQDTVCGHADLQGERLALRRINSQDFLLFAGLYGDDDVMRYVSTAISGETLSNSFNKAVLLSQQQPCERCFMVVEQLQSKVAMGIVGFTVIAKAKQIDVGVMFLAQYQTQHFAYEAMQVLISYLLKHYPAYALIAEVNHENRAAVWLTNRLGFHLNPKSAIFEYKGSEQ